MVKIVVIDTGINLDHPLLKPYKNISGFGVSINSNDEIVINNCFNDEVGHGTAIAYILCRYIKNIELIVIKAFDTNQNIEEKKIIKTLEYINDVYEKVDIVSMSFGMTLCYEKKRFEKVCDEIYRKGTLIVAAYDNLGKMTYPACFKNVLGVDTDIRIKKIFDYIYVKNSKVNIRANSLKHRLPGIEKKMMEVYGSSFAVPYIDVIVAEIIEEYGNIGDQVYKKLEQRAKIIINYKKKKKQESSFKFESTVVFPYQKETKNIARYLDAHIHGIYDIKNTGNIGKHVKSVIRNVDFIVEDIDKLDWNGKFDSVIIGYCKDKNITRKKMTNILCKCQQYGKKVYTFTHEILDEYSESIISKDNCVSVIPHVNDFQDSHFGKMWDIAIPVLCVVGTSSKQGKFSTQIAIREELKERGYDVGHLGTEPYASLLKCDACYPYGYDSNIIISPADKILYVNQLMHNIEAKDKDIIITGLQSNLWHYSTGNVAFYPTDQYEVVAGVNPDVIILCVNYNDEIEYIQKNIVYIEKIWEVKCLAIVIFPFIKQFTMENASDFEFTKVNEKSMSDKIEELEKEFKIPVFSNDSLSLKKLVDCIVDFFQEEGKDEENMSD